MPAFDRIHRPVENALVKDGWTITHVPLTITFEGRNLHVDLGAERLLAAEKGTQKIAVEIKTFGSPSPITDLQEAIGQFVLYEDILAEVEPERQLFLAISTTTFDTLFRERIGQITLRKRLQRVIVVDTTNEVIREWIPNS